MGRKTLLVFCFVDVLSGEVNGSSHDYLIERLQLRHRRVYIKPLVYDFQEMKSIGTTAFEVYVGLNSSAKPAIVIAPKRKFIVSAPLSFSICTDQLH